MDSPHAIHIRCDGAMDYDSKQTGGIGYSVEFPDSTNLAPLQGSIRVDGEGIHRLELMAVLTGINKLIEFHKYNRAALRNASGVTIHSDRLSVSDGEMNNPYRVRAWKKQGWKTNDGKPIKHDDMLDAILKARTKLSKLVSGRIEIVYTREKQNKVADKLSKLGKLTSNRSKSLPKRSLIKVGKRKFAGGEIKYASLTVGSKLKLHIYYKDPVQDEFEIRAEITEGGNVGKWIRFYTGSAHESVFHRHHTYRVKVQEVYARFIRVTDVKEVMRKVKVPQLAQ